jgi:hypothetical protein
MKRLQLPGVSGTMPKRITHYGRHTMSKERNTKKDVKKKPEKTLKEKRAEKKEKSTKSSREQS